jgi:hypothetical protein
MLISLHKNATTTPAIRHLIQTSNAPTAQLARDLGSTQGTVRKWRSRESVVDRSHTPHRLQKTLNDGQEALVIYLRIQLLLPLDDLLAVIHEFIEPGMSRSALDRLLRRHGVSRLPAPKVDTPASGRFRSYEPGYVHVDIKYLPQMCDEDRRRYAFVAIDRATRWVYVRLMPDKRAASARAFLKSLDAAAPFRIRTLLTDNGKELTDRLFADRARAPSGEHEFNQLCAALDIEHRLPRSGGRKPTAWSNASTDGLPKSCAHIVSTAGQIWKPPPSAMSRSTTISCPRKPSNTKPPSRR